MFYDETQAINKCEEEPSLIFSLIDEEHKELVDKLLTEKTVDINTKNIEEYDVLSYMLKKNWYDLVLKHMKNKKWNVNHQNKDGDTFAHILVMKKYLDVMEIIKQLLKNIKFIPNIRNKKGQTILDKSINNNYIYTTAKILKDKRFNNIDLISFKNLYESYIKNDNYGAYSKMNNLEIIIDNLDEKELLPKVEKIVEKIEVEKNIAVFLMLIALGCGLLCLSIFLLPLIITSPSKFSLCFAMGSLLVLISFLFYYGTKEYFRTLFGAQRFWISILFILSIIIGISFSLGKHYIISMLCSICQLVSLIVFILSFVPGGRVGINCIKKAITSPFSGLWMRMAASQIANS